MKLAEILTRCRASNDWAPLVESIPFARFLNLRIDVKGDAFTCILPFDQKLIGNPVLPALHGGATGGFLECAGPVLSAFADGNPESAEDDRFQHRLPASPVCREIPMPTW